jgi:hypothetical protein
MALPTPPLCPTVAKRPRLSEAAATLLDLLLCPSGVGARSGFIHRVGGSLTEKFSILVQKKKRKITFQRIKKF